MYSASIIVDIVDIMLNQKTRIGQAVGADRVSGRTRMVRVTFPSGNTVWSQA
jgi:hypothetical protein